MTERFGAGDFHAVGVNDERTYTARETFVDILREVAPQAHTAFAALSDPVLDQLFHDWPNAPALDPGSTNRLGEVAKRHGVTWPSPDPADERRIRLEAAAEGESWGLSGEDIQVMIDVGSPYALAFTETPPTPEGTFGPIPITGSMDDAVREHQELVRPWREAWDALRGLAPLLLRAPLDAWTVGHRLEGNCWVASHLLARSCKARLLKLDEARMDHVVFPTPYQELHGFAEFQAILDGSLGDLREWQPTKEEWATWRKEAEKRLRSALTEYKRVVEEGAKAIQLRPTPAKALSVTSRDFGRLIRWKVLGKVQAEIAQEDGEEVKQVQISIKRAKDLLRFVS